MSCFYAPGIRRGRSWPKPFSTSKAGRPSRPIAPAAIFGEGPSGSVARVGDGALTAARIAQQGLGRILTAGRTQARFRLHRLRQRRPGSLSGVARPAYDRALGRCRSRGRAGNQGTSGESLPRCLLHARPPNQPIPLPASDEPRQAGVEERNRPHWQAMNLRGNTPPAKLVIWKQLGMLEYQRIAGS